MAQCRGQRDTEGFQQRGQHCLPGRGLEAARTRDTEPETTTVRAGAHWRAIALGQIKRVGKYHRVKAGRKGSPRTAEPMCPMHARALSKPPASGLQLPPLSHRPDSLQGPQSWQTLQEMLNMTTVQSPLECRRPQATLI